MTRPTIYLSNWSSHRTPSAHGPGRKWSIMAAPRAWEKGDGTLRACTPAIVDLRLVQCGAMPLETYRLQCETRWDLWPDAFAPGVLRPIPPVHFAGRKIVASDGDTLCCACGKTKPCHRVWLAPRLHTAGWRVVLDGAEYAPPEAP